MKICAVKFCGRKIETHNSVGLPRGSKVRINNWKTICGINDILPCGQKRICLLHFESKDFYTRYRDNKVYFELKPNIDPHRNLPSVNDYSKKLNELELSVNDFIRQLDRKTDELRWANLQLDERTTECKELKRDLNVSNGIICDLRSKLIKAEKLNSMCKLFQEQKIELDKLRKQVNSSRRDLEFVFKYKKISPTVKNMVLKEFRKQSRQQNKDKKLKSNKNKKSKVDNDKQSNEDERSNVDEQSNEVEQFNEVEQSNEVGQSNEVEQSNKVEQSSEVD